MALQSRPELVQSRIQLQNSNIGLKGSRSQLLPVLNGFVNLANNGLAGDTNTLPIRLVSHAPCPILPGGRFQHRLAPVVRAQLPGLFSRPSVEHTHQKPAGPSRHDHRSTADSPAGDRSPQVENQIRVEVQNALIGVQQARVAYQASLKARVFKSRPWMRSKRNSRWAPRPSSTSSVQRDWHRRSRRRYPHECLQQARVELERVTNQTLSANNVMIDEAFRGKVSRPPSRCGQWSNLKAQ